MNKAQRQIEKYLANVRRALHDVDPAERGDILDNLRTHIEEALSERGGKDATLDDVRFVISSMDVPEAYRSEVAQHLNSSAKQRRIGRLALIVFLSALGIAILSIALGFVLDGALLRGGLVLGCFLTVVALGLGLASWKDPYGKATAIGAVLALACALLFLPVRQTTSEPRTHDPTVESVPGD